MSEWNAVEERVWYRKFEPFAVNVGLVVGDERALVVDTGGGPVQAAEIYAAVREVTDLPLVVVNTHAHFDHVFGNAYFRAQGVSEFWAHAVTAQALAQAGESQRAAVAASEPGMAAGIGENTEIVVPDRLVEGAPAEIELGGVTANLLFLGRGHTEGDVLVSVGRTLFTGDLVEEGADPSFEDSFPSEWIRVLGKIAALEDLHETFVPGHGAAVTVDFVSTQMNKMRTAVRVTKTAMDDASVDVTKAIPILPYGPLASRVLLRRLRTLAKWAWLPKTPAS